MLRGAVGLVAAYAIALQAVLLGILTAEHASADPFSITCASDYSDDSGSLPEHDSHDCGVCVLSCGVSPALPPPTATVLSPVLLIAALGLTACFDLVLSASRHQPQAARAPPSSV
jgi:hypothetical protein